MNFLVQHQGRQLGPFTLAQLQAEIAAGRVSLSDLCWREGEAQWLPVSQAPGVQGGTPGAPGLPAATDDGSALCIWSLVLGILAVLGCVCVSGIPAVICGHVGLARKARAGVQEGRGFGIAGLITGYLGIALTIVSVAVGMSIALPVLNTTKDRAKQAQSMGNARQIAMAISFYTASHDGEYPETLEELLPDELVNETALIDPLAPEFGADGYTYLRPAPGDAPATVIVVSKGTGKSGRRVVLRKDGSVAAEKYSLPPDL